MPTPNETPGNDAPKPGEEGNDGGEQEFELGEDGKPVLGEDGKPKPKAGDDEGKDGKGKRPPETPDAKRARLTRELDQLNKKHPASKEPKEGDEGKKGELDYAQMAYLNSEGIKEDDEQALAKTIMDETGKSLKDVVKGNYFKTELKGLREDRAAADALPGSKRGGTVAPNSVEAWLAKGGLPPNTAENQQLRKDIVNARTKNAKSTDVFSSTPVVH